MRRVRPAGQVSPAASLVLEISGDQRCRGWPVSEIVLRDAGKLQEEQAEQARREGWSKHEAPRPLFTVADVERALPLVRTVGFDEDVDLGEGLVGRWTRAGHILGRIEEELDWTGGRASYPGRSRGAEGCGRGMTTGGGGRPRVGKVSTSQAPTPEGRGVRDAARAALAAGQRLWADRDRTAASGWWPEIVLVLVLLGWNTLTSITVGTGVWLVGAAQIVPLLWRRREPLAAALGVALGCLLQVWAMDEPHPANVAVPIAVYSAAAFGSRRDSRLVLAIGVLGAAVAGIDWAIMWGSRQQAIASAVAQMIFLGMFVAVAWVLGDVVRRRKAVVSRLQEQNRALARDQAQRARLAAQDERASIAREMHDVVAHSLAVVVVQADGALYAARTALDQPPAIGADREALERAAATLETLAQTARSSLAETRKLVGVLREEGSAAEYSPLQGLEHLDDLVQRVRDSGVPVDLSVRGRIDDVGKDVDLAAYRVVQESLTNALKHAGPDASVDVDVLRTPAVLLVRVTDDGQGLAPDSDGEGNGILGMAERVEVLGGSVNAGPRARGGWEVVATIPVEPSSRPGGPERTAASGRERTGPGAPEGATAGGGRHGIPSTGQASSAGGEQ